MSPASHGHRIITMNKKNKKQLDVIRKKLSQLRQQLAGEKKQMDDLATIQRLEQEITQLEAQARKLESEP